MNNELHNFDELYQTYKDMVFRLCYLYLRNSSDAEDAVQSVFLKSIISNVASYTDSNYQKAWFITTSKNLCKNILKNWWRRRRVVMEDLPETPIWDSRKEQSEILEKLLSLPEKYKTVMYLYYFEEYTINEISDILKRKKSTIQTQLARGRDRLKVNLGGQYIGQQ